MSAAGKPTSLTERRKAVRTSRETARVAYETSGPAQLAKQGIVTTIRKADPDWILLRGHLQSRLAMLRNWRTSWQEHWTLLETYLLPRRGIFINVAWPTPNANIRGLPINQNIIDPTGTQAMRICASGMMSGLMSPGRPWFKLRPSKLKVKNFRSPSAVGAQIQHGTTQMFGGDAAEWFEEVEDGLYDIMQKSNFYDSGAQMFEDLSTFGTGPTIIYEDERDVIRCYNPCPGEYLLASSNANRVESMYRQFVMTISQIVEMFGIENCPRDVQEMWREKGSSIEVEKLVAHAIEPNFPIDVGGRTVGVVKGDFTWREVYWCWGSQDSYPLSMRGFRDQPHVCPRWAVTSNDPYGRSVAMDCLPDVMQLQRETSRKLEAIEKMVRPPLLASMELKNEPSSILPGHLTYVNSLGPDKGMRPIYTVNPQIGDMMNDLKEIQTRIKTGFFNDLFLMLSEATKEMTAYEVAQCQQEKLQVLGPVVERFQNEFASPAIQRIFRIAERKGVLPDLPDSLKGIPISIEYVSMLSLAQKASATAGMERYAQMTAMVSQTYPEAKAMLKPVEYLQEYSEQLGVSRRIVGSEEDVEALKQQIMQQQQAEQGMATAQTAIAGARDLSQTDVGGGNSALAMMLGNAPTAGNA